MRQLVILLSCIMTLTGCAVSSINVLEKKETKKPFSRILTIYVDGGIEFSLFDSTTYNICLKTYFIDTSNFEVRKKSEDLLYNHLSAPRSLMIRSSDIFGLNFNSYNDFLREIDSLAIDAVLLVNRRNFTHIEHPGFTGYDPFTNSSINHPSFKTLNAAFVCYLIQAHDYLPLWKAQIDVKGKRYAGKAMLRAKMVRKLEKNLASNGYMVPHR